MMTTLNLLLSGANFYLAYQMKSAGLPSKFQTFTGYFCLTGALICFYFEAVV